MPISTSKVSISTQAKITKNSGLVDTGNASPASATSSSQVRATGGSDRNLNVNSSSRTSARAESSQVSKSKNDSSSSVNLSIAAVAEKDAAAQSASQQSVLKVVKDETTKSVALNSSRERARKETTSAEASSRQRTRATLASTLGSAATNKPAVTETVSPAINAGDADVASDPPPSPINIASANNIVANDVQVAQRLELDQGKQTFQSLVDTQLNVTVAEQAAAARPGVSTTTPSGTGVIPATDSGTRVTPSPRNGSDRIVDNAISSEIDLNIPEASTDVSITVNSSNVGLAALGMNVQTPEIIGIFDFPTFFDDENNPTSAAQALDVQYQFKQAGLTAITNLLAPYASNLGPLEKLYKDGFEDNAVTLEYYEAIKSTIVPLLRAIDFMDSNPQQKTATNLSLYENVFYKFEDVYSLNRKILQNFMVEELHIDERVVRSFRNTAGFLQVASDIASIMLYGARSLESRSYTDTDGFKIFGPSTASITRANTIVASLATDLDTTSSLPVSSILSADVDELVSAVNRSYMFATSGISDITVASAISLYVTSISDGDVLLSGTPASSIAACAFGTQNGGSRYLPLETSIVSRSDVSFGTGREIFVNDFLTGATAATSTGETLDYCAEVVGRLLGDSTTNDDDVANILADAFLKRNQDAASFPVSTYLVRKCLESISSMIETYSLNQPQARYSDILALNIIALTNKQGYFSRIWKYLKLLAGSSESNSGSASEAYSTALTSYRENLLRYFESEISSQSADFNKTANAGQLGNQSIVSATGTTTIRSVLESVFDPDGGMFRYIVNPALSYLSEVESDRSGNISFSGRAGAIGIDAVFATCLRIFQQICENGLTISYVPPSSQTDSQTRSPYAYSARRFNSALYYPDQVNSVKYLCEALTSYTTDSSLSSALTSTISDDSTLQFSRDFCRPIQETLTNLVKQDVYFIYLIRCVSGFANSIGEFSYFSQETSVATGESTGERSIIRGAGTISDSQSSALSSLLQNISTNVTYFSGRVPAADQAYFVENFSDDQLITSIASNLTLGKRSQDHPFFPVSKVVNAFEMQNLKTYLQNLDFRTNNLSDRNRILAVGLPAGLRSYLRLQNSASNSGSDSDYQLIIRLFARNQRQDSDPIVIADFKFDTRVFVLGGLSSDDFLNNSYESLSSLFMNTPFRRIKGVNSIESITPDSGNLGYLINHYNDYYCKLLLKSLLGVDLAEYNFCFDKTITSVSPDASKIDTLQRIVADISSKYTGTQEELAIFTEALKRTIFFNSLSYQARAIYTKIFDRIFCIPINLDALTYSRSDILLQDIFCVVYLSDGTTPAAYSIPFALQEEINTGSAATEAESGGTSAGTRARDTQSLYDNIHRSDNIIEQFMGTDAGRQIEALVNSPSGGSFLPAYTDRAMQAAIEAGMLDETMDRGELMSRFVESESLLQNLQTGSPGSSAEEITRSLRNNLSSAVTQAALSAQQSLLNTNASTAREIASANVNISQVYSRYSAASNYYRRR